MITDWHSMSSNRGIEMLVPEDTRKQADACHQRYWADNGRRISSRNR